MDKKARILVIDDEEIILTLSEKILSRYDYNVTTAHNGASGISIYEDAMASTAPFDVVLLDLTLGEDVSGESILARLKEIDPSAQVIVCSGHSSDSAVINWKKHGFAGSLVKPFHAEDLVGAIKKVVGESD